MAKAKKTVRKSRRATDRCRPLRETVARLEKMIDTVEDELAEPDIPPPVRRRLEALLKRLKAQLRQAQAALRLCEAIP